MLFTLTGPAFIEDSPNAVIWISIAINIAAKSLPVRPAHLPQNGSDKLTFQ